MKTTYHAGKYYIKIKGRGLYSANLTKQEAKMIFKFQKHGTLEILGVAWAEGASETDIDQLSNLQ